MEFVAIILLAAATFGVCYLVDKGFSGLFRNQAQHHSGLSVRLSKKYSSVGLIFFALGLAAIFTGINSKSWLLGLGGGVVTVLGICLVVYYMTFGVFYDREGFVLTTFGKRSVTYLYNQIQGQKLYEATGSTVIELHMTDGRTVALQSGMTGVYPFLDAAFENWCRQTGREAASCDFHDPDNSLWFPTMEDI